MMYVMDAYMSASALAIEGVVGVAGLDKLLIQLCVYPIIDYLYLSIYNLDVDAYLRGGVEPC
jgi:hypothetical protein